MNSKKKRVLIIDDQLEIRELVDVTLRSTEFDIIKAPGGKEGIQIAKEQKPDLILLDIIMPGFDGYMTCKVLKRNTVTRDIPVIFLTAKKAKEDIQTALKAGASDYIVKPFSPSELLTHLRGIGESHEIRRAKKTKEPQKMKEEKELPEEKSITKYQKKSLINIKRYDNVVVLSTEICGIVLENCKIFRDIFANFVSDEIFKVVIDFSKIEHIDSAGLGLLISVKESFRNYGGDLRITSPSKEVNNRFSFIRLTDLFHPFNNMQEAIESFQEQDSEPEQIEKLDELNICMSCTFVNISKARYCSFCGTNLVLGKGDAVLKILTQSISHRIFSETNTTDINEINKARDIKTDDYKIPSKFLVEINDNNLTISYQSNKTDSLNFKIQRKTFQ